MGGSHQAAEAEAKRKTRAIVFVTDTGFLMTSLFAALQVARSARVTHMADIFVVTTDLEADARTRLEGEFATTPIRFAELDARTFLPPPDTYFNKTHISRTALGRFALHEALPSHYEHVVYLDGDIQAVGEITELVAHDVRPGFIAAGNEFLWLCENDIGPYWRRHRAYLDELEIKDPRDYFNSGVLAFRMDTWREMAPKALDYFRRFPERCIYHDQSALNAVFRGRREILSPIYNFGTEFAKLGPLETVIPRILHFTGAQKPWHFSGPPWNGRFIADYADFLQKYPILRSLAALPSSAEIAAIEEKFRRAQGRYRLVARWRALRRRRRFRRYLDGTQFDVG